MLNYSVIYREVVEGEEFLALPVSQVIRLIQSDKLMVIEEKVSFVLFINIYVVFLFLIVHMI